MTERWMEELRNKVPTGMGDSNADAFAAHLQQRAEAARKLEEGLLTEVPILYGSPGPHEPEGDSGIVISRLHREELLRRSGTTPFVSTPDDLPRLGYGRLLVGIVIALEVFFLFARR